MNFLPFEIQLFHKFSFLLKCDTDDAIFFYNIVQAM